MKKFIYILMSAVVSFTGCKEGENEFPQQPIWAQADAVMAQHQAKEQEFSGDAESGFSIEGEQGTIVDFPANAFVDANGDIVTGEVQVTLIEILSKKDIMLSGIPTESNGKLLESGGEILVKAEQNGAKLDMNPVMREIGDMLDDSGKVVVKVPNVMGAGDMNLFLFQNRQDADGQDGGADKTWTPAPAYYPFGNGPNSYFFNLPGFTWVNCDRFYSDPRPKTTVTVTTHYDGQQELENLQVFLVFKDITTVITFPPLDGNAADPTFRSYSQSLPIGAECKLIVIGKDVDGSVLFMQQDYTVADNDQVSVELSKTTAEEINQFFDFNDDWETEI